MSDVRVQRMRVEFWSRHYGQVDGQPFHALLCDPPYHLTSITERFGKPHSAAAQYGRDGAFARASRGFMGKAWDGGDVAFQPETWAALAEHLYPGAFGMAFASTRGWHRMAVAIEDAGLIIHPTIMAWSFGSGFPKATNLHKPLERSLCVPLWTCPLCRHHARREEERWPSCPECGNEARDGEYALRADWYYVEDGRPMSTEPPFRHPFANVFYDHRYGLQALKPALEPVICFQKPYERRPMDDILDSGAGVLNIGGARIEVRDGDYKGWGGGLTESVYAPHSRKYKPGMFGIINGNPFDGRGRWPANLVLSAEAAAALDAQTGDLEPGFTVRGDEPSHPAKNVYGRYNRVPFEAYGDEGGASRFFHTYDWAAEVAEGLLDADPVFYSGKASRAEREAGLTHRQMATVNDGRDAPIDNPYQRGETPRLNPHPTIKPLALTRWLATLLLPPAHYAPRRLLVPFSGSGSEVIGAMQAGWEAVESIERDPEYAEVQRARLLYWRTHGTQLSLF